MSPLATIQRIFENCGDVDRERKKYSIASSAIEHQKEQWSASPFGWNDVLETTNVVRRPLYCVRVSDRDRRRGSIIAIEVSFGFMEEPNVERLLEEMARHQEIDLPPHHRQWVVHASQENLLPSRRMNWLRRMRFRLFLLLRLVSQPAYYYYGLGDEVQLSVEIIPVRVR